MSFLSCLWTQNLSRMYRWPYAFYAVSYRVQSFTVGTRCSYLNNWIITNAFLQVVGHCVLFRRLLTNLSLPKVALLPVVGWLMNCELQRIWKEAVVTIYLLIHVETDIKLKNTSSQHTNQYNQYEGLNLIHKPACLCCCFVLQSLESYLVHFPVTFDSWQWNKHIISV